MARGAAQARRQAAKRQTQRKQAVTRRPPTVEQTMFFPRLRRQAKWVFVFLAFVFAAGFVFFGVGSGSTGIGDLLRGNFNIFGGGGSTQSSAVKKALARTNDHPNDPAAWNALASAYQSDGKVGKANSALEHALKLRPNDTDALQRVAGYYESKATAANTKAQALFAEAPAMYGPMIGLSPTNPVGQLFDQDQLTRQVTQKAQAGLAKVGQYIQKDAQLYARLAKLQPDDVNVQYHYGQLEEYLGNAPAAIAAYKKVIKLAPQDPAAAQARAKISALGAQDQRQVPGR
jgi:tetratricopeptide (TPR) repeat protein